MCMEWNMSCVNCHVTCFTINKTYIYIYVDTILGPVTGTNKLVKALLTGSSKKKWEKASIYGEISETVISYASYSNGIYMRWERISDILPFVMNTECTLRDVWFLRYFFWESCWVVFYQLYPTLFWQYLRNNQGFI